MKPFIASQKKVLQLLRANNANYGFILTYIPCYTGSEKRLRKSKQGSKARLNERNTYRLFLFFHYSTLDFALPFIINKIG